MYFNNLILSKIQKYTEYIEYAEIYKLSKRFKALRSLIAWETTAIWKPRSNYFQWSSSTISLNKSSKFEGKPSLVVGQRPWASNWFLAHNSGALAGGSGALGILLAHVAAVNHVLAFDFLWNALGFTVFSSTGKERKDKRNIKKKHPRTLYQ